MKYNRTELGDNIGFSAIIDEKFKTNSLLIRFITGLDSKSAADNAVGMGILTNSSSQYKTLAQLNEKLSSLYGASLSSGARKRGDVQVLHVSSSWINNKYAIDGEDITSEMLEIICGCIFSPNASEGSFDNESFRIVQKELMDKIEAEINNKRGYALSRAAEFAFSGEPAENSCYGTKETAGKVTAQSAYQAYKNILENAQVEIFYVAPEENPDVEKRLKKEFSAISRSHSSVKFCAPSKIKEEALRISEEFDVRQSKMVLVFKTESDDCHAIRLLSTIFGETPVSKLFMNVREKMSLCYYCASRVLFAKGSLSVDCGVERDNIEKAEKEILHQLDEIRSGNFSDEELSSALMSIDNTLTAVGDTPSSYSSWYFERFCENNIVTPEQQFEAYKAVTRERIINAAKSLTLDTVYLMLNKEVQN